MNSLSEQLDIKNFNFNDYYPKNEFDRVNCFLNLVKPILDFRMVPNGYLTDFEGGTITNYEFAIFHKHNGIEHKLTSEEYIYFILKKLHLLFENHVGMREPMYSWIREILTIMDSIDKIKKHLEIIRVIIHGSPYWVAFEEEEKEEIYE